MASTSAFSGLVSGLDTKTMISQLMQLEAIPQTQLRTKLTTTNSQLGVVQAINAKAASMTTSAEALAKGTLYTTPKVTSSSTAATAVVTGAPAAGSVSFTVTQLAAAHSVATSGVPTADFTITKGGKDYPIAVGTGGAAGVAAAINASGAGISAAAVTDKTGATRLVLTSTAPGAASSFTIAGGGITTSVLTPATNAEVSLGTGFTVASATNTFDTLVAGASITVSATATTPVTVTTVRDAGAVTKAVSGLVASMNTVLGDISFHGKAPVGGQASTSAGGLLAGNSTLRDLGNRILDTVSGRLGAETVSLAGLEVTREGTVKFDEAKLTALLASDPAKAQSVLTAFGETVRDVGSRASSSTNGSLTLMIESNQSRARDLTNRIDGWDARLDLREATLSKKWLAMETALQRLQSQSGALTSSLNSMFDPNKSE